MNTPASNRPIIARWLLLLTAIGITYGSLYPFKFASREVSLERIITVLISDWQDELSIPNIFANIVLFVPYGLFGALAFPGLTKNKRCLLILTSAAILAFGIQVIQIWFPFRVPTMADGIINMVGVLLGMALAASSLAQSAFADVDKRKEGMYGLPLLLLLTWLAYRWFPFVPSLDVFALKQGLKPLLLHTEWRPLNFIHNLTAWLVFALLWQHCRFRETRLWLVIPGSLAVQFFVADNPILLHNILAAMIAPPLWFLLKRVFQQPAVPITLLLIVMLLLMGLRPFETSPPSAFQWVPFTGFLSGNMMVNTSSLLEKLFLYGSLIWLILNVTRSRTASLMLPIVITGSIELAQIWLVGRGAEITDPLLCAMIWWVIIKEQELTPNPKRSTSAGHSANKVAVDDPLRSN